MASRQVKRFAEQLALRAFRRNYKGAVDSAQKPSVVEVRPFTFVVTIEFRAAGCTPTRTAWIIEDGAKKANELSEEAAAKLLEA